MLAHLNQRLIRARLPKISREEAEALAERLLRDRGKHEGISHEDMIELPDRAFFRRKGDAAFTMVGFAGESFTDVEEYVRHLAAHLPEPYLHSRDMKQYVESLRAVVAGANHPEQGREKKSAPEAGRGGVPLPQSG